MQHVKRETMDRFLVACRTWDVLKRAHEQEKHEYRQGLLPPRYPLPAIAEMRMFKVGEWTVKVPSKWLYWHDKHMFKIVRIIDHGEPVPGVSHQQTLIMESGEILSAWWFDENAPNLAVSYNEWDDCTYDEIDDWFYTN